MTPLDQYMELFKTDFELTSKSMKIHLDRFKLLDNLLPPSSTFFLITNTQKGNYEFISSNFEYATGLSKATLNDKGIPYFLSLIHTEEIHYWLQIVKELMEFYLTNYEKSWLNRLEFQYNYRIKVGEEKYLNILENQVNLISDDQGKPIVGLGHFTVFGRDNPQPMKAVARILNEKNEYETVFRKVYGSKLLEQGITNRELDILRLISLGFANDMIAEKLSISIHTVQTHRKNMLAKSTASTATELVVQCIKEGIL
jgi:DNA-binding CsgD family transcriptional regulator